MTRRQLTSGALAVAATAATGDAASRPRFRLALFHCDITPALGTPVLSGVPVRSIADPLFSNGFVLLGPEQPIVLAALDWCEIRNDAYDRWRAVLAQAAGTTPQRVLVTCLHQHDAPYVDTGAQRLIDEAPDPGGRLCVPAFNEQSIEKVAAALRESLRHARRVTHIGTGEAKVEQVASNRRYVKADGKVSFERTSAARDPLIRNMPEGLIDPFLKTLSFWDGAKPVAAISCYATHPMSYYGKGDVSADFVGLARSRRQQDTPGVAQVYLSGCAGDTMAGRYNDGNPANRAVLAGRVQNAMAEAWKSTKRHPLTQAGFRSVPLRMEPRRSKGFSAEELRRTLADRAQPYRVRSEAALGLSWLARCEAGRPIDVPAVDFGPAQLMLMPAESFVQYQLWAQKMRPDSMVMVPAYGECAPGYIPTAESTAEGYNDRYSWIAFPECERTMVAAMTEALRR